MPARPICHLDGGLELRTLHRGLAARIFQTVDAERAQLGRWLPWVHSTLGLPDTVRFLQNARDLFLQGGGIHGAIWYQDEFVGMMALHVLSKADGVGNVGYWLSSRAQGKGIVTRLLAAFLTYCFDEWRLHRVELMCAVGNEASCRVAERVGFRLEGVLREARLVNGAYTDMKLYALLEQEWRTKVAAAARRHGDALPAR